MAIQRISLIMPAFNESAGISEAIAEAHESLAGLGYEFEILVVDDGSSDATAAIVADLSATWNRVRLLAHSRNLGYGAALRTGFLAARYDLVAFTDADRQFFLDDLEELVNLTEDSEVVVGRRLDRKDPWRRRFLSKGYNLLARTFLGTGIQDVDCAMKVFRKEALEYLLPETNGFFVNTEMISRARRFGWNVAEVGVRHRPRTSGTSTVSMLDVPRTFSTLLRYWWKNVLWAEPISVPVFGEPVILPFPARQTAAAFRRAA